MATAGNPFADPQENRLAGFRSTDPKTSRSGAIANYPRSGSQRWECLLTIARAGATGMTAHEVEQETQINGVWKRVSELHADGWIADTGRTRMTRGGAQGIVYVVPPEVIPRIAEKERVRLD